ncbi:surface-adhesin E family protein [Dinghuibacter silviterrae]|uniref:surface-adhesin E family protein n=1 Tax=Dinghuibacter silviterrae TaxID=1539049 RepID=UPI001062C772|nr:hypothetical protein [Dinghuibacter silviterrae]
MKKIIACPLFFVMSFLFCRANAQVYLEDLLHSSEWILSSAFPDSSHVHFIRRTCIRTDKPNLIKIWILVYHESFKYGVFTYKGVSEKVLTLIDFGKVQMRPLAVYYYDSGGHLLYSEGEDQLNSMWDPVVPDSMGEGDFNKAAKMFYQRKKKQ